MYISFSNTNNLILEIILYRNNSLLMLDSPQKFLFYNSEDTETVLHTYHHTYFFSLVEHRTKYFAVFFPVFTFWAQIRLKSTLFFIHSGPDKIKD